MSSKAAVSWPVAWVPGVNHHRRHALRAFYEFTDVCSMQSDFEAILNGEFKEMIEKAVADGNGQ